ncbi:hypothetical protein EO244_09095 [Ancylomarina salipaludis]|uniref:GLPGLI family protein n=1 Tax=Ancylomarina salipaludis TaxID=2501299 RepID=A0A4Q1JMC3_9BACT|nr:hypothetical protein [Ancylomarina salipaludis]RXQ94429.1 hypothetical protein EO244_09095 [Ancylomarina salipaludis]
MKHTTLILIVLQLLVSCSSKSDKNKPEAEGTITYNVCYETKEDVNPIVALLPTQVEYKFKNNNISILSEGYLGFFSTRFISKYKAPNSSILFKILNNKMNYQFSSDEIPFIYNHKLATNIKYLKTDRVIAGYKCKLARVYIEELPDPIDVYYTQDIYLKDPNRNTPFNKIDGVLLEFETTMNKIKAKFSAQNISLTPVSKEEFLIPSDYIKSDAKTIIKYVSNFN